MPTCQFSSLGIFYALQYDSCSDCNLIAPMRSLTLGSRLLLPLVVPRYLTLVPTVLTLAALMNNNYAASAMYITGLACLFCATSLVYSLFQ